MSTSSNDMITAAEQYNRVQSPSAHALSVLREEYADIVMESESPDFVTADTYVQPDSLDQLLDFMGIDGVYKFRTGAAFSFGLRVLTHSKYPDSYTLRTQSRSGETRSELEKHQMGESVGALIPDRQVVAFRSSGADEVDRIVIIKYRQLLQNFTELNKKGPFSNNDGSEFVAIQIQTLKQNNLVEWEWSA